jgi:hypothetical protein
MRRPLMRTMISLLALAGCAGPETGDAGRSDARADGADAARVDGASSDAGAPDASGRDASVMDASAADVVDASAPAQDAASDGPGMEAGPSCVDLDGDGYGMGPGCRGPDCDDANPSAFPGATELCDGRDNDCDERTDEELGQSMCGVGACARTVDNCSMGRLQRCEPGAPSAEVCNGMDDDCDGMADNEIGPAACYSGPMGTQSVGRCRAGTRTCAGGMLGTCAGEVVPDAELCNGMDDDCDGTVDNGIAPVACYSGPAGTQSVGRCRGGARTCSGGVMTGCVGEVLPTMEVCNGVDDDCDGAPDNGIAPIACYSGPAGTQGVGRCRAGARTCVGGSLSACIGEVLPTVEVCNGVDDDCDGAPDNGIAPIACYSGPPGTQGIGRCRAGARTCMFGAPSSCLGELLPFSEVCNGIDDNCDGVVDNGIATGSCYSGPNGTAGIGICRSGTSTCLGGTVTCTGQVVPLAEVCGNGLDDNCNGTVDDGCACTPAVPNDTCGAATVYTVGATVSGNTTCARSDYTASCGFNASSNDAAYAVALDGTLRTYTFTMTGAASFDTVLHMHSSVACGTADEVACTDDTGSINVSTITPSILPAGTYYLVADGFGSGNQGTFTLTSSAGAETVNDTCAQAVTLTRNGTYRGTTAGRAHNHFASCASSSTAAPDVVFAIPVPAGRSVTVSTCGSSFDTVLYASTTCGSSTVCNDDSCGTGSSITLPTPATATTYFVVVDGYLGASGAYTLNVSGL